MEVTGISPTTYRDDILFYFENRRSGGGDVADVKYQPGSGVALVTFEESEGEGCGWQTWREVGWRVEKGRERETEYLSVSVYACMYA